MNTLRRRRIGRWPQFRDEPQDVGEQISRNGNLSHLKRDTATVAHDLRADLDQLFLQACQRPVLDRLRFHQASQEVGEIIGKCMKLKANRVGGERAT